MMTPDVNVSVLDFGETKTHEVVTPNADGSYTIFINSRLSYETQQEAYQHALSHIENSDFEKANAQEIEAYAHGVEETIPANKYLDRIERLKMEQKQIKRRIKREQKRVQFMLEHCGGEEGAFIRAENYKLYGDDF